jgi:hypothetical protein
MQDDNPDNSFMNEDNPMFRLELSKPHYSRNHELLHKPPDPLVGYDISIRRLDTNETIKIGVVPFKGQTTLDMYGIRPTRLELPKPDHSQMSPPNSGWPKDR